MENNFTSQQKKILFDKISSLSYTEHEEILKIISSNDVHFSKNKNGVFFNLSTLPNTVIKQIDDFVLYCVSNKKELDEYDKKLNECKINNNFHQMLPQRHNLQDMGKMKEEPIINAKDLHVDEGIMEKFVKYVDRMTQDKDKIGKKKSSLKYNNAKKKYAKKVTVERKFDHDHGDQLEAEEYLIKTKNI